MKKKSFINKLNLLVYDNFAGALVTEVQYVRVCLRWHVCSGYKEDKQDMSLYAFYSRSMSVSLRHNPALQP